MTRLYHADDLYVSQLLTLGEGQTHYLRHVLRATIGHRLAIFNERDGEWSAVLTSLSKAIATVTIEKQLRPAVTGPDVSLLFAPIKHDPLAFLIEKATELGVRHFHPVMTERCNISRVNHDRVLSNLIEAAQQSERFDIPTLYPLMPLRETLSNWHPHISLLVCQERGEVPPIVEALRLLPFNEPIGFLVGPEGGFSHQEIAYLKSFSFTKSVSLGPRILRAETAALAAVTCYQALVGDWRTPG
jgi:16S rRNA (uracil1498-N3)-methyltransferase